MGPLRMTMSSHLGRLAYYERIEWKWTLQDLEEASDVAYQDILKQMRSDMGGGGGERPYCDPE